MSPTYAAVALDLPVDRLFTYRVPVQLRDHAAVGHRVRVPFRGRSLVGIVAEVENDEPSFNTLDVAEAPDEQPLLTDDLLALGRFVARYYGSSLGEALAAMLPRGVRKRAGKAERLHVVLAMDPRTEPDGKPLTEAQTRVVRQLKRHADGYSLVELCRRARCSNSPVHTLEKRGIVAVEKRAAPDPDDEMQAPVERRDAPTPTKAQAAVIDAVREAVDAEAFAAFLLLGVTGSGKTEIYLRAIRDCRARGRQAIVLVPEIALTPQTVRRFRRRFDKVEVLHSAMTEAERASAWRRIRAGEADVVIGPRSAIFAPVPKLGLLVVDEEHEATFKQQNTPRYHARDVGIVRAQRAGAVVLLGSATPSLETYRHALEGKYGLLRLPERVGGRSLPTVQIADRRSGDERVRARTHMTRTLEIRIEEALRKQGQVILLQNRRGYATSVSCRRCGFVVACTNCDVALTYHRSDAVSMCHLCGHEEHVPSACPDCALPDLKMHGIGTQTVEEELGQRFPDARVARMDSDSMATRASYEEVLDRFGRREIDILVGTQMIAKGLDFPHVLLVGIISADTAIQLPDFRAGERTFALLAQVAGRAGRGESDGRVVIQTLMPDHPAITMAADQDFEAFAKKELEERRQFGYPPFRRLLRVVVRGKHAHAVEQRALDLQALIVEAATKETQILGPGIPPIPRVQGMHRRQLLVKAPGHREIADVLACLRSVPRPRRGIEESWDVDPVGVL